MPSGRAATRCIRSCVIRIGAVALRLSVSAMPRSGLEIALTSRARLQPLGGSRTPVRVRRVPIRTLASLARVVATIHMAVSITPLCDVVRNAASATSVLTLSPALRRSSATNASRRTARLLRAALCVSSVGARDLLLELVDRCVRRRSSRGRVAWLTHMNALVPPAPGRGGRGRVREQATRPWSWLSDVGSNGGSRGEPVREILGAGGHDRDSSRRQGRTRVAEAGSGALGMIGETGFTSRRPSRTGPFAHLLRPAGPTLAHAVET